MIIAMDLGTTNTKVYRKPRGVIFSEKTSITIDSKNGTIECGDNSYEMYEKTPIDKRVVFPIRNGVIADFDNMTALINHLLKKAKCTNTMFSKCVVYIAVPIDISEVERKAFIDLLYNSKLKIKEVISIPKPIAAGIGAGIDTGSAKGHLSVDFGADTTEIAVISLGGIVTGKLLKIGGNKLTEAIISFVKKQYNLTIGFKSAENIKLKICSASKEADESIDIVGRDIVTGLPKKITITSLDVFVTVQEYLYEVIDAIKYILEKTPPELSADIIETGIFFTGGGACLKDFDKLVSKETGLTVHNIENPEESVISGLGKIITDLSKIADFYAE